MNIMLFTKITYTKLYDIGNLTSISHEHLDKDISNSNTI